VGSSGLQRKREWRANQGMAGKNDDGSSQAGVMVMILIDSHCGVMASATAIIAGVICSKRRSARSPLLRKVVRLYITMHAGVNKIFGRFGDQ
jgi:hypothetical protein